jgi:hypothetical protein
VLRLVIEFGESSSGGTFAVGKYRARITVLTVMNEIFQTLSMKGKMVISIDKVKEIKSLRRFKPPLHNFIHMDASDHTQSSGADSILKIAVMSHFPPTVIVTYISKHWSPN